MTTSKAPGAERFTAPRVFLRHLEGPFPQMMMRSPQSVSISPPSTRMEAPVVADAKGEAR